MAYKKYDNAPKRDFRQELTDNIIAALEKGVPPWKQGWDSSTLEMPQNPISGKTYRGGNVLNLMLIAAGKGYDDPRWVTYRQAQENGWQVRKGEHGSQVEFWKTINLDDDSSLPANDDGERTRFVHRVYTVFNACQIDGIPERQKQPRNNWQIIQSGEAVLKNSGAAIIHAEQSKAFYRPVTDTIHLPRKEAFHDAAEYYGTALHELAHWSGASHRLNRETMIQATFFGDPSYAKEELRAELASVFLMAERGIPYNLDNNAAYLDHWLQALRKDKNEIFRAARDAHQAADYLIALEFGRTPEEALAIANGTLPETGSALISAATPKETSAIAAQSTFHSRQYISSARGGGGNGNRDVMSNESRNGGTFLLSLVIYWWMI